MKLDVPEGLINFDQPEGSGRDGDVDGETRLAGCCPFWQWNNPWFHRYIFMFTAAFPKRDITGTKRYHVDELHVKTRSHTLVQMMCLWYIYSFILQNYCTKIQLNIWEFPKIVGFPSKSSILIEFSIINHPFWGTTILGNPHVIHQGSFRLRSSSTSRSPVVNVSLSPWWVSLHRTNENFSVSPCWVCGSRWI